MLSALQIAMGYWSLKDCLSEMIAEIAEWKIYTVWILWGS